MEAWDDIFEYRDGNLYWIISAGRAVIGDLAGTIDSKGYRVVTYNKRPYKASRIIYEMFYGDIPKGMFIDHINRDQSDNRIENLRAVTPTGNQRNHGKRGFSWKKDRNKWAVSIRVDGDRKHIGLYECMLDARSAYLRAQKEYWYGQL